MSDDDDDWGDFSDVKSTQKSPDTSSAVTSAISTPAWADFAPPPQANLGSTALFMDADALSALAAGAGSTGRAKQQAVYFSPLMLSAVDLSDSSQAKSIIFDFLLSALTRGHPEAEVFGASSSDEEQSPTPTEETPESSRSEDKYAVYDEFSVTALPSQVDERDDAGDAGVSTPKEYFELEEDTRHSLDTDLPAPDNSENEILGSCTALQDDIDSNEVSPSPTVFAVFDAEALAKAFGETVVDAAPENIP
jgi:hypothetical protein